MSWKWFLGLCGSDSGGRDDKAPAAVVLFVAQETRTSLIPSKHQNSYIQRSFTMRITWKALTVAVIVPGVLSLSLKPDIVDSSQYARRCRDFSLTALQVSW
jgi:hypothetical protein